MTVKLTDYISPRRKVLIIKTGYSETLAVDGGGYVSLGDILRTTVILHSFPPETYEVTWMVDRCATTLLVDNQFINRLWVVDGFRAEDICGYVCDIVLNLEKDVDTCVAVENVDAETKCGFLIDGERDDIVLRSIEGYNIILAQHIDRKRYFEMCWSSTLFKIMDVDYNGEDYILGYRPRSQEVHDIGLNHEVGKKFPSKRWPEYRWRGLHERLAGNCTVSWQQGQKNLEDYIDWINSCRVIVSNDSLGLHLAIALGKKVVALFGPTSPSEFGGHPGLYKIVPDIECSCSPLHNIVCPQPQPCMNSITIECVAEAVEAILDDAGETLPGPSMDYLAR